MSGFLFKSLLGAGDENIRGCPTSERKKCWLLCVCLLRDVHRGENINQQIMVLILLLIFKNWKSCVHLRGMLGARCWSMAHLECSCNIYNGVTCQRKKWSWEFRAQHQPCRACRASLGAGSRSKQGPAVWILFIFCKRRVPLLPRFPQPQGDGRRCPLQQQWSPTPMEECACSSSVLQIT